MTRLALILTMTDPPAPAAHRRVKCDDRCQNARGSICECKCQGAHHGQNWQTDELQQNLELSPPRLPPTERTAPGQ